jgi:hypothetical protein
MAGYDELNATFASRLQAFIAASGGRISIGSGYRSVQQQEQLVAKAKAKYGDGWRKWVAPPGKSNHNRGLAADLQYADDSARAWAHANAAAFGLNFPMGHEPWHIEPIGVRDGSFEEVAAPAPTEAYTDPPDPRDALRSRAAQIYEIIMGQAPDESVPGLGRVASKVGGQAVAAAAQQAAGGHAHGGGTQTLEGSPIEIAARAAYNAGFRGDDLVTMLAVAGAESGWRPDAHGVGPRDDSWGLWQINRMASPQYDAGQLTDPAYNAQVAYEFFTGRGFKPWSAYTTGAYEKFLDEARSTVSALGLL